MSILLYYKDLSSVSTFRTQLQLEGHSIKLRSVDFLNESETEHAKVAYIAPDVDQEKIATIAEYLSGLGIEARLVEQDNDSIDLTENNETVDFETLEEAEAYKAELLREVEAIEAVITEFKTADEAKQKHLKQEAADAQKLVDDSKSDVGSSEETNKEFEYPTRDNMIMELRDKEVSIPRNATLEQLRPLYDEHIRTGE